MKYKYNFMLRPVIGLTRELLSLWKESTSGKDVKHYTNLYASSIYKIGNAVATITDALKCFNGTSSK